MHYDVIVITDQSHDVHLHYRLLHHRQLLSHLVMLAEDALVPPLALPALHAQLLVAPQQGLGLLEEFVAFCAGDVHEVGEFVVLHLEGELEVFLDERLLLTLDALVGEEELELLLGLELSPDVLELEVLVDLHAVPLVELAEEEVVELLEVLRLQVEVLAEHEHLREVLEDVLDEQLARLQVRPVQLVAVADLVVHRLEQLHQLLPLVCPLRPVLLDDLRVHLKDVGLAGADAEVELLLWLLRDARVQLLPLDELALEDGGGGVEDGHDLLPHVFLEDVVLEVGELQDLLGDLVVELLEVLDVAVVVADLPVLDCAHALAQLEHALLRLQQQQPHLLVEQPQRADLLGSEEADEFGEGRDVVERHPLEEGAVPALDQLERFGLLVLALAVLKLQHLLLDGFGAVVLLDEAGEAVVLLPLVLHLLLQLADSHQQLLVLALQLNLPRPQQLALLPRLIARRPVAVLALVEGLLQLVVPLLQHPVLLHHCLRPLAELPLVVLHDLLVLLQLFLRQLRVQLYVVDVLLLGPQVFHYLEHCLQGLDDGLDAGIPQPLCVLRGLQVGVEVRVGEAVVEGGLDGVDEFPVVGEVLEGRPDVHPILLLLHQLQESMRVNIKYQYFRSMKLRMYSPLWCGNQEGEQAYSLRCSIRSFRLRYIYYRYRRMRVSMTRLYCESFSRSPKVRLLANMQGFPGFYLGFGTPFSQDSAFLWSYGCGLVISLSLSRETGTCSSYSFSFLYLRKFSLSWVQWMNALTWPILSAFSLEVSSSCSKISLFKLCQTSIFSSARQSIFAFASLYFLSNLAYFLVTISTSPSKASAFTLWNPDSSSSSMMRSSSSTLFSFSFLLLDLREVISFSSYLMVLRRCCVSKLSVLQVLLNTSSSQLMLSFFSWFSCLIMVSLALLWLAYISCMNWLSLSIFALSRAISSSSAIFSAKEISMIFVLSCSNKSEWLLISRSACLANCTSCWWLACFCKVSLISCAFFFISQLWALLCESCSLRSRLLVRVAERASQLCRNLMLLTFSQSLRLLISLACAFSFSLSSLKARRRASFSLPYEEFSRNLLKSSGSSSFLLGAEKSSRLSILF